MSRAFVKEDDSEPLPIVPPRAALPLGTPNYVTPNGLALLRTELSDLEKERAQTEANYPDETERTRQLMLVNGRIQALTERLASAKVIDPRSQATDQIRFGATVTLRTRHGAKPGAEQTLTIVGVDEASVAEGKLAFIAPFARTLIGASVGQEITIRTRTGEEVAEVVSIIYPGTSEDIAPNKPQAE